MRAEVRRRQTLAVTPLDRGIVDALVRRAGETGEPFVETHSGAAHDTSDLLNGCPARWCSCRVEGVSHHPDEDADPLRTPRSPPRSSSAAIADLT